METGPLEEDLLQELAVVIIHLPIPHHPHPVEVVVVVDTTNKTLEDPDTIMDHHHHHHLEGEITILTDHLLPLQAALLLRLKHHPLHRVVVHHLVTSMTQAKGSSSQ